MTAKIVNLTAHNIDVYDDWGNLVATYKPRDSNQTLFFLIIFIRDKNRCLYERS